LAGNSRRLHVIFNPTAGWRRRRRLARVLACLGEGGASFSLYETRAPGDAEAHARTLDPATCDAVVAAGGDGTINEVLNGLGPAAPPLGIVPLGTANVLATELGLPRDPPGIARYLAGGRPVPAYLGSANGRRFAMMAGIGYDARVVEALDLRLKRLAGKGAYVASALAALARHRPVRYEVELDGAMHEAAAMLIAKAHYYGGRFVIASRARLDEPIFQVALFGGAARFDLLRYAAAIGANRVERLADVRFVAAREVRVAGGDGERVQLDGDLGPTLPLRVNIVPNPVLLLR
jgi:YegS/Rv2252/BmrU family lipid kinase